MYLEIKQLVKTYANRRVVSGIDLSMDEGEILSLLGPSGCGKTTILRMIAGLIKPDDGFIQVGGRVFYENGHELPVEDRQLGMVFQDFALWPHMTVASNIGFGLRLRRQPARQIAQKVAELLELVNLPGYGDRFPHQLSGGQQQRIAVARALATSPRIVLLDEPLSSLDTGLRASMREELVQLFKRLRITAINVTHDQDEAMMMSDRIMILRDGQIQQMDVPSVLYTEPENVFVAAFIGQANMLAGKPEKDFSGTSDHVFVRLDGSEMTLASRVKAELINQLGSQVVVMCRPDNVNTHAEAPITLLPNVLQGTVEYTSYVGGRWRTLIRVSGQPQPLLSYPHFAPYIGQDVWLELPPDECRVLPVVMR